MFIYISQIIIICFQCRELVHLLPKLGRFCRNILQAPILNLFFMFTWNALEVIVVFCFDSHLKCDGFKHY